jgi:hypothetical protein
MIKVTEADECSLGAKAFSGSKKEKILYVCL